MHFSVELYDSTATLFDFFHIVSQASESVAAVGVAAVGLPRSPVNSAGESSASSTPSSSDSSSNGSDASDLVEGEREPSVGRSAGTEENKQDYTSGKGSIYLSLDIDNLVWGFFLARNSDYLRASI